MPLDTCATMQHYLFILSFLYVLRIDEQNPVIVPGFLLPEEALKSPASHDFKYFQNFSEPMERIDGNLIHIAC